MPRKVPRARAVASLLVALLAAAPSSPAEEPATGTEIEGRAVGASSGPHGQGLLTLRRRTPDGTQEVERVPVGVDGSFRTRPLERDCTYDLLLTGIRGRMGARRCGLEAGTRGVVLEAVDGLTLSGRLLDDEGNPPPAATHLVFEAKGAPPEEPGRKGHASTAVDGSFAVEDLGPFAFTVSISGGNFEGKPPPEAVFRAVGSPVEIRAGFAFFLAGRLVAPGDTFDGCRVIVRQSGTRTVLAEVPVGRDGRFRAQRLPRWRLDLSLRVREEEVAVGSVDLPGPPRDYPVDVPDPPASRRLEGTLLQPGIVGILTTTGRDGRLAGASIALHAWEGKPGDGTPAETPAATGTTDAEGRWASPVLPAGWYEARIRATGHRPGAWNVLAGQDCTIGVHTGGSIAGIVTDASTGEGVEGAFVTAHRTGPGPEACQHSVASGPGGAFEIALAVAGTFEVSVHGGGSRLEGPRALPGDLLPARVAGVAIDTRDLRIPLVPGGAVGGVLLDGEGAPLSREDLARLHLVLQDHNPDADLDAMPPTTAPKSPGGEFRFGSLRHGRYGLLVGYMQPGSGCVNLGPFPMETGQTALEVRLPIGGGISGRVVDEDGKPFARPPAVQIFRAGSAASQALPAETAADGTFRSGQLDPTCAYDVLASTPGRIPAIAEGVRPGATDVVLVPARGASIHGIAVDETGAPLPAGTGLYARPALRQDRYRLLDRAFGDTGSGGSFQLDGLIPDTAYFVDVASRERFLPSAGDPAVTAGATAVVLEFRRGCVLAGRIVDATGTPLGARLDVRAEPAERGGIPGWTTFAALTDQDGRFRMPCVPPGRLRITASRGGQTWSLGEVTAPADDLTLSPR